MDEAERCTHVGYIHMSRLLVCGAPEDLKRLPEVTPPGSHRLEVETDRATEALGMLRRTAGILDATLFGQAIHILAAQALSTGDVRRLLVDSGYACHGVREIEPSLEDVFVMLTRSRARAAEEGG